MSKFCYCGREIISPIKSKIYCSKKCNNDEKNKIYNKLRSNKLKEEQEEIRTKIPETFIMPNSNKNKTKYFTLLEFLLTTEVSMLKNNLRLNLKRNGQKISYKGRKRVSYCLQDIEDLIQYYHKEYRKSLSITLLRARERYLKIWKRIESSLQN